MGYRLFLAGGGTGGHVFPNLAFARYLEKSIRIEKIFYLGLLGKPEEKIIKREEYSDIHFLPINARQFPRVKDPVRWILFLKDLILGIMRSLMLLFFYRPGIVISSGGFVSVPVLVSCAVYRVVCRIFLSQPPLIISVEPNVDPGLANSTFGLLSDRIFTAFRETGRLYGKKALYTGYPVRSKIRDIRLISADERDAIKQSLGIPDGKKVILVSGGSQGARNINTLIADSICELAKLRDEIFIIHSTGLYKDREYDSYEWTVSRINSQGIALEDISDFYQPRRFLYNMTDYLSVCDLAIVRGGAGSVFEILDAGIPAIFIPKIEVAGEHQLKNCREIYKRKLGAILYEYREKTGSGSGITIDRSRFISLIRGFLGNDSMFEEIKTNLKAYSSPDPGKLSAGYLEQQMDENKNRHERYLAAAGSIFKKTVIVIGVLALVMLYHSRMINFLAFDTAVIFLMHFYMYMLRKDSNYKHGFSEKIYISSLFYAFAVLVSGAGFCLLLSGLAFDRLMYIPLIILISVNNILRKLLARNETEIDALLFLMYMGALSLIFFRSFHNIYLHTWISFYFLASSLYLLACFIRRGIKRQMTGGFWNDFFCFGEVTLLFLFFLNTLLYLNGRYPSSYRYLSVSVLLMVPFINLVLGMARNRFSASLGDDWSNRFLLSGFFRGIIFYTLPVIIILIFMQKEIQYVLAGSFRFSKAHAILPFFAGLSPLLILIPLAYLFVKIQKLKGRRDYILILAGLLMADIILKNFFLIPGQVVSVLISLYPFIFIVVSRIMTKKLTLNPRDEITARMESAKLLIVSGMFLLGLLCFRFNNIDSAWSLIIPLFVSSGLFLIFSRIMSLGGVSGPSEPLQGKPEEVCRSVENLSAVKFSQLSHEALAGFDREYLLLRLNSFRHSGSWWFENCAVKLIGNMKKEDELPFLLNIITEKCQKNIIFRLIAGNYMHNAIKRRNAVQSVEKIGIYSLEVEDALKQGLSDMHFEVRSACLTALRRFSDSIIDTPGILDRMRMLVKDRYFMVSYEALKCIGSLSCIPGDLDILLMHTGVYNWKLRNSAIEGIVCFLARNPGGEYKKKVRDRLESILLTSNDYKASFEIKTRYNKLMEILEN